MNVPQVFRELLPELRKSGNPGLQVLMGAGEFVGGKTERLPMRLDRPSGGPMSGGEAGLYIGSGKTYNGPFELTYRAFSFEDGHDHEGGETHGFFDVEAAIPGTGVIDLAVQIKHKEGSYFGFGVIEALPGPASPAPGEPAIKVKTPTEGDRMGAVNLCTRNPPCALHSMSLDEAAGNGKPLVLVISSPRLCRSGVCGPVLDEVLSVQRSRSQASYVHLEPYKGDEPTELGDAATAWRLRSEPWTYVLDGSGTIAHRFEGPVVASEVERVLDTVLS